MLPVWYKAAKPLIDSGELAMLGVVQEQHAERALLYRQWKKFEFPIVQDATTSLDLAVVPVPVLVDEHGVVRNTRPRPRDLVGFVKGKFNENGPVPIARRLNEVDKLIDEGNRLLHESRYRRLDAAMKQFKQALKIEPDNGKAKFSLGVVHRMRFDSQKASEGDFEQAARLWSEALAINPNQYIWRRRIEQYGPRLGKPYPFYDWIDDAVAEIRQRGETPVRLTVNLTGTETARPARKFSPDENAENPDPESQIIQSEAGLVQLTSSTVPAIAKPGSVVRAHLNLKALKGKWNDEAGPISVWIDETSSGTPENRAIKFDKNSAIVQRDTRNIDFEFKLDKKSEQNAIRGFVLFHICDDEGVCFYYRKNFQIDVPTQ